MTGTIREWWRHEIAKRADAWPVDVVTDADIDAWRAGDTEARELLRRTISARGRGV